jgi:hypothetical protein
MEYKEMIQLFARMNEAIEKIEHALNEGGLKKFADAYYIYSYNYSMYNSYIGCFVDIPAQIKKLHDLEEKVFNRFQRIREVMRDYYIQKGPMYPGLIIK